MYSNRKFDENDFDLRKVEGNFLGDLGGLVRTVGKTTGGVIRDTGRAGEGIFGGITGGISGIFSTLFWPLMVFAAVVAAVIMWNLLAEDPMVRMEREREERTMKREMREEEKQERLARQQQQYATPYAQAPQY